MTAQFDTLLGLQDEAGMPRIDRNIDQVQQMSEMMVARIRHRDSTADGLASARLLAQQGLNQRQCVTFSSAYMQPEFTC